MSIARHDTQTTVKAHRLPTFWDPARQVAQQQEGCDEEQPRRLRLAVAQALLEGDAGHRREERPHQPHRRRVARDVLDDGLMLRQTAAVTRHAGRKRGKLCTSEERQGLSGEPLHTWLSEMATAPTQPAAHSACTTMHNNMSKHRHKPATPRATVEQLSSSTGALYLDEAFERRHVDVYEVQGHAQPERSTSRKQVVSSPATMQHCTVAQPSNMSRRFPSPATLDADSVQTGLKMEDPAPQQLGDA